MSRTPLESGIIISNTPDVLRFAPPTEVVIAYDYYDNGMSTALSKTIELAYPNCVVHTLTEKTKSTDFLPSCSSCESKVYIPPRVVEVDTVMRLANQVILDESKIALIQKALAMAGDYHAQQVRSDGRDYFTGHITPMCMTGIANIVRARDLGLTVHDELASSALIWRIFHDSLEDSGSEAERERRAQDIAQIFGQSIVDQIKLLTKDYSIADRHERNRQHAIAATSDPFTYIAKMSDTRHNLTDDLCRLVTAHSLTPTQLTKIESSLAKYSSDYDGIFAARLSHYASHDFYPIMAQTFTEYRTIANLAAFALEQRLDRGRESSDRKIEGNVVTFI